MEELKSAIHEIVQQDIIKVVISNKINNVPNHEHNFF